MSHIWAEGALTAAMTYMEDGTTGINATLATIRTEKSLSAGELPDIALFEKWYHRASQATSFPYLSMVISTSSGEDEVNTRAYDHLIEIAVVVPEHEVTPETGNNQEQAMALTAVRYGDAIKRVFNRRIPQGSQGWTLAGSAQITRAEAGLTAHGIDPELNVPNRAFITPLIVRTTEDF